MTAPKLARPAKPGEPGYPGGRVYEHPVTGKVVPSITGINSVLAKDALKFWAARQCAEYAASEIDVLLPLSVAERVELIRKAPWRTSDKAANDGDIVHDAIDAFIKIGQSPSPELLESWTLTARRMWRAFTMFNTQYKPQWMGSEFTVWSDRYGYAGTGDWYAQMFGALILGDTKTGKNVYPEVGLQVAAIANADYIIHPDGTQQALPKFDRFAVLHIRPTFARLQPLNHVGECFQAFTALRTVKFWQDYVSADVIADAPKIDSPLTVKESA